MKKLFLIVFFILCLVKVWSQVRTDPRPLLLQFEQSKPDTGRISICIQLAEHYFKRARLITRLDSVKFYIEKAQQLNSNFQINTFKNKIAYLYAKHYSIRNPLLDPRLVFLPVIDSCKKTEDRPNEALAWRELGSRIITDSQSAPFKLKCFDNAMVLAKQLGDKFAEQRLIIHIAAVHKQQRKIDLAEQALLGLMKEEQTADPSNIMYTSDALAALYVSKGEYNKGLEYALKTLKLMDVSKDSNNAANFFNRLSEIYYTLGKSAESLEWSKKGLDYKIATENLGGAFVNVDYIAYLFLEQGRPKEALAFILDQTRKYKPTSINEQRKIQVALGDTYNALKMFKEAATSYEETIRLGNLQTQSYPVDEQGYDNCNMGSFYYRQGQYQKALPFLQKALKNYETYGELGNIKVAHLWLYKTDSALGDYSGAIHHLRESNRLDDSIFNISKNKQIEELQIAYQTEQKDKSIKLLADKEQLSKVQLRHAQSTRNWIIAGAALLLVIAGLLYRQARIRKKNSLIINTKNQQLQHLIHEKEWLLREVHHRVKNNLHTVIGLLESQAAYLENDALKANEISKHRIYAMSLIHQQLYRKDDIKNINMSVYLFELLDYLGDSFGTGRKILFHREIEPLKLGVSQAIPIGLIVNEAVTNAIKYAFPLGREGKINISLHQVTEKINLIISDDGIGMDPAIASAENPSFGLKLIKGLTEDIDGEINFINENGTRIEIGFLPDPLHDMSNNFHNS